MGSEIKKQTRRLLTYGLYVLTAAHAGEMTAGTVNWLSHASFNPPLVMLGAKADSRLHALIERSGAFAVNVPAASQKNIAFAFFRATQLEGNLINRYAYEPGPHTGAPQLTDLPAWFEARVSDVVKRGDHTEFVAEVVDAGPRDPHSRPLELWDTGWYYGG